MAKVTEWEEVTGGASSFFFPANLKVQSTVVFELVDYGERGQWQHHNGQQEKLPNHFEVTKRGRERAGLDKAYKKGEAKCKVMLGITKQKEAERRRETDSERGRQTARQSRTATYRQLRRYINCWQPV